MIISYLFLRRQSFVCGCSSCGKDGKIVGYQDGMTLKSIKTRHLVEGNQLVAESQSKDVECMANEIEELKMKLVAAEQKNVELLERLKKKEGNNLVRGDKWNRSNHLQFLDIDGHKVPVKSIPTDLIEEKFSATAVTQADSLRDWMAVVKMEPRRQGQTVCPVCPGKQITKDYGNVVVKHVCCVHPEEAIYLAFYHPVLFPTWTHVHKSLSQKCSNSTSLFEKYVDLSNWINDGRTKDFPLLAAGEMQDEEIRVEDMIEEHDRLVSSKLKKKH